ncbi:MAG: LPS assembly lipoprotein LptE [Acidobacteria bacterium]|nr:LPS assembly lipoprotein LptE [Acidobacteriota bacterium]
MNPKFRIVPMLLAGLLLTGACGYQRAGQGARIPSHVKTIAVPVFQSQSTRFRIEQRLAAAITREFLERTRFSITAYREQADAVLEGTVLHARSHPVAFDPNTGRATTLQLVVTARIDLRERETGNSIFSNPRYTFREQYQIDPNVVALFEEDEAALERIARDMAQTLVSEILENF